MSLLEKLAPHVQAHIADETARGGPKVNVYTCTRGHQMVTRDVDVGVTPFITDCPVCNGRTTSALYRVDQSLPHTHEWYRPDSFDGMNQNVRNHVEMGGLLLRQKPAEEPKVKSLADIVSGLPEWEVSIYRRTPRTDNDVDVKSFPYQADIFVRKTGFKCSGVAMTPALALCRAAAYWEARSDAQEV